MTGYSDVEGGNDSAFVVALAKQPLSVAIEADERAFQVQKGGREGGREGRREGGKEGGREGGKKGGKEGGREGRREGGKKGRRGAERH